jgi:hypothetical protein
MHWLPDPIPVENTSETIVPARMSWNQAQMKFNETQHSFNGAQIIVNLALLSMILITYVRCNILKRKINGLANLSEIVSKCPNTETRK